MKCLVTGGAGFIGSHLVEELIKRGHKVVIIDNLCTGSVDNVPHDDKVELVKADIRTTEICYSEADVVFHLAARKSVPISFEEPHEFFSTNIDGTWNILKAFEGKRIVCISSSSVEFCASPYAITKKTGEYLCDLFPNTVSLRFFNVFGERQPDTGAVIPAFCNKILNDEAPIVFGDGSHSRDYTYVKDVVNEVIEYGIGSKKELTGPHSMGYGTSYTVNRIAELINKTLKKNIKSKYIEDRPGDVPKSQSPEIIQNIKYGFEKGLKRTIEYYGRKK